MTSALDIEFVFVVLYVHMCSCSILQAFGVVNHIEGGFVYLRPFQDPRLVKHIFSQDKKSHLLLQIGV